MIFTTRYHASLSFCDINPIHKHNASGMYSQLDVHPSSRP